MYFPLIIGVGGIKSGVGKTLFIERFIAYLKRKFGNQITICAIKYTKTSFYSQIITDKSMIEQPGKDSWRIKKAGADFVYWVKALQEDLPEVAEKLYSEINNTFLLSDNKKAVLIIEGNSMVRIMQPDVIIFLKGYTFEDIKPSGKAILEIADIVVEDNYNMEDIMTEIEKVQQKKLIEKLLQERSNDGKITCAEARKIAEELNVPYIEVGRAANELKIKLRKCELGCF